jgi:simple sugar transport system substrate-binding protein
MSEHEFGNEALERLEWSDAKRDETPQSKARAVTRRAALGGGAGALAAFMLSPAAEALAASNSSIFGSQKSYHFVFVNHVTTNPFFTPTIYGIADACKLLGCTYSWTGSTSSNVGQMVTAFNSAIAAGADGIACPLISLTAFNGPTNNALAKNIPVLSYNADATGNNRLAYIGQDLYVSGQQMGLQIKSLIPGGGSVGLFIATPGSLNIQPRIDGAENSLKGTNIKYDVVATGAAVPGELTAVETFWKGHTSYKGLFAVDGGSSQACGQTVQKFGLKGKVFAGGYDFESALVAKNIADGYQAFTIDQQPYLQGFLPTLELFLYHASGGLSGIADVDTGLKFVTKSTVAPYNNTSSRFEGTSSSAGVKKS